MKFRILNLLIVFASLFAYLEWGSNKKEFLFQMEKEVLIKLFTDTTNAVHPFTILPLLGQLFLIINTIRKKPSKKLMYIGVSLLSILIVFIFIIGILSKNFKIVVSVLPFIAVVIWVLKNKNIQYDSSVKNIQ